MTEITNYITNDYKAIDSQETIAAAQEFLDELTFSHFPVVEEQIYIGSIASEDIETFNSDKKIIEVVGLLERRVDAKTAVSFYKDLTPIEDTPAYKSMFQSPTLSRDRGAGRPTKRDRREIDDLQEGWFD